MQDSMQEIIEKSHEEYATWLSEKIKKEWEKLDSTPIDWSKVKLPQQKHTKISFL